MKPIPGMHHVTAIASDPQRNLEFYTGTLGLRLVKLTVNFDDPGSYHLYYADRTGSPGSVLTFFAWPGAARGSRGTGQATSLSFGVRPGSLGFWANRLFGSGASLEESQKFGERVLVFTDPDNLLVELVESEEGVSDAQPAHAPDVPEEFAITCLHSVALTESDGRATARFLEEVLGFHELETFGIRTRYRAEGGAGRIVDLVHNPQLPPGRIAAGTVHHVAFRTPDDASQAEWREHLTGRRIAVTPVRDRQYFHSIYFNEPGAVLFEIATDVPGFAVDEPVESLGSSLRLPPWLEPQRAEIELRLPHLNLTPTRNFV